MSLGEVTGQVYAYNLYPTSLDYLDKYKMPNLVSPRTHHTCVSYFNDENEYRILVAGGESSDLIMMNYLEVFANDQWSILQQSSLPVLTRYASMVAKEANKILLFGGQSADYMGEDGIYEFGEMGNWTRVGSMGQKNYGWTIVAPFKLNTRITT